MQPYDPKTHRGRLVLSDIQYAVMRTFYSEGRSFEMPPEEVLTIPQPTLNALLEGELLEETRKHGLRLSWTGEEYMSRYEGRSPFKKTVSKQFPMRMRMNRNFRPKIQILLIKKAQEAAAAHAEPAKAKARAAAA
jgi:hypothetical protein